MHFPIPIYDFCSICASKVGDKLHRMVRTVTAAGLLHDIGKVLHRGLNIDGRAHSLSGRDWVEKFTDDEDILDCIRYHHHQELESAKLKKGSPAYIVYIADNISSGVDRRDIEGEASKGFDINRPLESVYNLLNNSNRKGVYKVAPMSDKISYPGELECYAPAPDYNRIIFGMGEGMQGIDFKEEYINSLIELSEAFLTYVPSSTFRGEVADISLFDHSKITAALAACITLYLESQAITDYYRELFQNRHDFYREKAFCLLSCDISGIQPFIYTISSKGALKGLRARSFYLELMLENLADEILSDCSLYRVNLLYTGGGHAYILLPNTKEAQMHAQKAVANINRRLIDLFGSRLFVAHGLQPCSASELMNKTGDPEEYRNIFHSVAAQISERKLRRYSAEELRQLNNHQTDRAGRECRVCGVSDNLIERPEGVVCKLCASFSDISRMLIKPDTVFAVSRQEMSGASLPLFTGRGDELHFNPLSAETVRELLQKSPDKMVRIYSKNTFRTGFTLASKLWMGDYAAANENEELKTFAELAESSHGIKRIGVLRADVDNMGAAFVSGFVRENAQDKYRYLTLSRTATLSRSLSVFFKYYLNGLLSSGRESRLAPEGRRNIVVVYSGGDDLFLVGAWNEVLAAAMEIRAAFSRYTGDALSISAGFAMFEPGYPIARMAAETAELEALAKTHRHPNGIKDSISLFGREYDEGTMAVHHTYDWRSFESKVMGEKYTAIDMIFAQSVDYGSSFLYSILDLLRRAGRDSINIARLAYLLARREPGKGSPEAHKNAYGEFAQNIYRWALDDEDRRQLITAILIYTYYNRDEREVKRHE